MQDDGSQLKSLDLAGSEVSSVDWASLPPALLAQVLVSLEGGCFRLRRTFNDQTYELSANYRQPTEWTINSLSLDHVTSLFNMVGDCSVMNMKSLTTATQSLDFPPELLSSAVTQLESFWYSGGTSAQFSAVFTRLSVEKDHRLRTLNLAGNDLSSVSTDLLVAGISGLYEVYLSRTYLTTEQLTGIYRMVADRGCPRMREIGLYGNDLDSISQDLLDRAELNQSVAMLLC